MRLIDADVLKEDLTRFYDGEVVARRLIDEQPTVDAMPVVKCRDCKHHHYEKHFDKRIHYCDRIDYGYGWQDNDFCSRGERKDGDHHDYTH